MAVYKHYDVSNNEYDVVIVGGGIAGAIMAKELGEKGKKVLVLEAGIAQGITFSGYTDYLNDFYNAEAKTPESPYPMNPNALQPDVLDVVQITPQSNISAGGIGMPPSKPRAGYLFHKVDDELEVPSHGYFEQEGPLPFRSTYTRALGGSTLHWLGTCLRMVEEDFTLQSKFNVGLDWPIEYKDIIPYYEMAEREIGVSADLDKQRRLGEVIGVPFSENYQYPMFEIPPSYLDQTIDRKLGDDMTIELDGQSYPVFVTSTPQGRNGMPNPNYEDGKGYIPVGAVGNSDLGQRCAGNSACVPICPIQAKYSALKTLDKIVHKDNVDLVTQAVASRILIDEDTNRVVGIEYKAYKTPGSSEHTVHVAKGKIFVLAAHAVENAKLLLASGIESTSKLVGKNLMDHPVLLAWGLMPEYVGAFRGPLSTSGIESLRAGDFRQKWGASRIEIGNEGWNWTNGDPYTKVGEFIEQGLFGEELQEAIANLLPRQFRIGFLVEQLPIATNRVTIDDRYRDQLGIHRPVIQYDLSDYERAGLAKGREISKQIFAKLGISKENDLDFTEYPTNDPGYFTYEGEGYVFQGAGHFAGTHIMGTTKENSVVDKRQRSWDHENLFLTGCGSMPTMGTANPTLTVAALAFMAAQNILADLEGAGAND